MFDSNMNAIQNLASSMFFALNMIWVLSLTHLQASSRRLLFHR